MFGFLALGAAEAGPSPGEAAARTSITRAYERLLAWASSAGMADELQTAKREWFEKTGELFDTDASFERRIASFLEWYTLDRAAHVTGGETPVVRFLAMARTGEGGTASEGDATPDASELAALEALSRSHLSVFEFHKVKLSRLHLTDLLTRERLAIFERRAPAGLASGDLLEARLVQLDGERLLTDTTWAHPREVRRVVLRVAKRFVKAGDLSAPVRLAFVQRLAHAANRCERYRHVPPKRLYAELENDGQPSAYAPRF